MPRPPSATVSDLLALLRGEPAPAAWLVQQLGVTRPVLSRLVAEAGGQVLPFDGQKESHALDRIAVAA